MKRSRCSGRVESAGARRRWGCFFFRGRIARIHFVSEAEIRAAWQVFEGFADKDWSFTDCTSKVLSEGLAITHAFAFDARFRQFGSVTVCP